MNRADKSSNIVMGKNLVKCKVCNEQKEIPMGGIRLKEGIERINEFIAHHKQCGGIKVKHD